MQHLAQNRASNRNTFKFTMHSATSAQLPMFSPWRGRGRVKERKRVGAIPSLHNVRSADTSTISITLHPSYPSCMAWLNALRGLHCHSNQSTCPGNTVLTTTEQCQVGILILRESRRQWKQLRFLYKCIVSYWLILSVGTSLRGMSSLLTNRFPNSTW